MLRIELRKPLPIPNQQTWSGEQVDPVSWDASVCHTYYYDDSSGNVAKSIWEGDNPLAPPPPPIGLYCDPATLTN